MTASVARFIESFILKITIFSWTLIVLKRPLQECCHYW